MSSIAYAYDDDGRANHDDGANEHSKEKKKKKNAL
jgi:hypothetical protein